MDNKIVDLISTGNVIGWFQGRMEFGPRSLGNRSILGDPRNEEMQKTMNLRIKQRLKKYTNPDTEKQKIFSLKISSKSEKIITAKDASGDAIKFKNELTINAQVFMNDEYRTNLVIIENFIYDNNSDTFELRAYENQIKNNLAGTAVDKILTKLANIL